MPRIVLIQGSLSPQSKTALVVEETQKALATMPVECETLDLRSLHLEFCDGRSLKDYNADMQKAYRVLDAADGFIFGMPVYCWSFSGVLKNFIDITAGAMENKAAGILCNAGGPRSFMASSDLIKVLFYESSVIAVHPIVYTSYDDFEDGRLVGEKALAKIHVMAAALMQQLPGGREVSV